MASSRGHFVPNPVPPLSPPTRVETNRQGNLSFHTRYDYQNRWVYRMFGDDGDGHAEQRRIFVHDGNQIVMDFWRANSGDMQVGHLRQRYLWGPAVDQILAEEEVDGGTADLV